MSDCGWEPWDLLIGLGMLLMLVSAGILLYAWWDDRRTYRRQP